MARHGLSKTLSKTKCTQPRAVQDRELTWRVFFPRSKAGTSKSKSLRLSLWRPLFFFLTLTMYTVCVSVLPGRGTASSHTSQYRILHLVDSDLGGVLVGHEIKVTEKLKPSRFGRCHARRVGGILVARGLSLSLSILLDSVSLPRVQTVCRTASVASDAAKLVSAKSLCRLHHVWQLAS